MKGNEKTTPKTGWGWDLRSGPGRHAAVRHVSILEDGVVGDRYVCAAERRPVAKTLRRQVATRALRRLSPIARPCPGRCTPHERDSAETPDPRSAVTAPRPTRRRSRHPPRHSP